MFIITFCQGKLNAVFLDPDGLIVHRFGFSIGFSDIECQNGFLVMMDFSGFCGLPAYIRNWIYYLTQFVRVDYQSQ
jgi:hypothetical protein